MKNETNIMDNILGVLMETSLENALREDVSYIKSRGNLGDLEKAYKELELTDNAKEIINQYTDELTYNHGFYGKCAYKTGFRDCIILLKELGVIAK